MNTKAPKTSSGQKSGARRPSTVPWICSHEQQGTVVVHDLMERQCQRQQGIEVVPGPMENRGQEEQSANEQEDDYLQGLEQIVFNQHLRLEKRRLEFEVITLKESRLADEKLRIQREESRLAAEKLRIKREIEKAEEVIVCSCKRLVIESKRDARPMKNRGQSPSQAMASSGEEYSDERWCVEWPPASSGRNVRVRSSSSSQSRTSSKSSRNSSWYPTDNLVSSGCQLRRWCVEWPPASSGRNVRVRSESSSLSRTSSKSSRNSSWYPSDNLVSSGCHLRSPSQAMASNDEEHSDDWMSVLSSLDAYFIS